MIGSESDGSAVDHTSLYVGAGVGGSRGVVPLPAHLLVSTGTAARPFTQVQDVGGAGVGRDEVNNACNYGWVMGGLPSVKSDIVHFPAYIITWKVNC